MAVIGITGGGGSLGRRTAHHVLATQPSEEVVVFSRSPASLSELLDLGATTRYADFDRPDGLEAAFGGVDSLLLISTDAVGRRRPQHAAAIAAAAAAGVKRIAYTSMPNVDRKFPAAARPLSDDHAVTEQVLRAAGPSWTILRNALYLEVTAGVWSQAAAATGQLTTNNGAGRVAYVARDDCAAAAAAVLLGQGHDNVVYDIGGPRLLDDEAIAAAISAHSHLAVEVTHVSDEEYEKVLRNSGLPADRAGVFAGLGASTREGLLETALGDTERLINRAPIAIDEFFDDDHEK